MIVSFKDIFLFDSWGQEVAMNYIAGIYEITEFDDGGKVYWHMLTLDFESIDQSSEDAIQGHVLTANANRYLKIFKSGVHGLTNPPRYYIDWAISKQIEIPWLDWAIEKGYYSLQNEKVKPSKDLKPKERETMIRIIHALAKNGYKYPTHGSLKDIVDDFHRNLNGASETTLKKYLDEFSTL